MLKFLIFVVVFFILSFNSYSNELGAAQKADLLLLKAKKAIDSKSYEKAVVIFDELHSLDLDIPSSSYFFYAKSLNETQNYEKALRILTLYINTVGRDGDFYSDALELIIDIEDKIQIAKKAHSEKLLKQQQLTKQKEAAEQQSKQDEAKKKKLESFQSLSATRTSLLDLLMVTIPSGSFQMGSNYYYDNGTPVHDEKPVHHVNINRFKLMATEVTWDIYQFCVDDGICEDGGDEGWGKGNRPVINVSWNDITSDFIPWLNKVTGQTYRLPTEAEWEYAAKAGTNTLYSWGNKIDCSKARYGYFSSECGSPESTIPVKSFSPNAFGLYDMHGNVQEWVQDCWNKNYNGAPSNGRAWMSGVCISAVVRGGSYVGSPSDLRSAHRHTYPRSYRNYFAGFRLAQDIP